MKKSVASAILGLMLLFGTSTFAQDSTEVLIEEPKDTISIDNMEPVFFEEESTGETCMLPTWAIVGGVVVLAGGVFYFIRKKKK